MSALLLIAAALGLMIVISDMVKPKNPTGLQKQDDFQWDVTPYVGGCHNALSMENAARARGFTAERPVIGWRESKQTRKHSASKFN